jgi:branched-chain amino acid transport system substrate-binding protein
MKKSVFTPIGTLILVLLVISILAMVGCGSNTSSTTSTTQTTTNQITTTPVVGETQILKIGMDFSMSQDVGLDAINGIQLLVDNDNANGGLNIGGVNYQIQLITYDNNNDQATEVASINRLIFQDKVKYILSQGLFEGSFLQITESNKVILMSQDAMAMIDLAPTTHYSFNPTFEDPEIAAKIGWFCQTYPDLAKNILIAYSDNQFGHMIAGMTSLVFKPFGVTPKNIFFPANQVDLSAVGTKIVNEKPSVVMSGSGSSATDGMLFNTVHQAGYHGQFFAATNNSISTWLQVTSPEALEGFITGMYATEATPALTPFAEQFKQLWIAKYGKWTDPNIFAVSLYSGLKAALLKADSIDTDKVSDAFATGISYSAPTGDGRSIARPDLGNNRMVDSIADYYIKQIKNVKAVQIATIKADDALKIFEKVYGNAPASAGGPPSGSAP